MRLPHNQARECLKTLTLLTLFVKTDAIRNPNPRVAALAGCALRQGCVSMHGERGGWRGAGMLNKGVLALNVPVAGLRGRFMLTKTLEWNLRWCVLDSMFDEKHFRMRDDFVNDPAALQLRFKCAHMLACAVTWHHPPPPPPHLNTISRQQNCPFGLSSFELDPCMLHHWWAGGGHKTRYEHSIHGVFGKFSVNLGSILKALQFYTAECSVLLFAWMRWGPSPLMWAQGTEVALAA